MENSIAGMAGWCKCFASGHAAAATEKRDKCRVGAARSLSLGHDKRSEATRQRREYDLVNLSVAQ